MDEVTRLSNWRQVVPQICCLALFTASSPLGRSIILVDRVAPDLPWFVLTEMASLLACSIFLLARERHMGFHPLPVWLFVACLVVNAVGSAALIASSAITLPPAIPVLAGLCCGLSAAPILRCALGLVSQAALGENMVVVGATMGLGAVIYWGVSFMPHFLWVASMEVLLVASSTWLYFLTKGCGLLHPSPRESNPRDNAQSPSERHVGSVRAFLSLAGVPLIGVLGYNVLIKAGLPLEPNRPLLFGVDEELLLFVIAAVTLVAVGLTKPSRPLYTSIYQVVVPAFSSAILICISFPNGSPLFSTGGVLIVFATAFVLLFAIAVAGTLVGSNESTPTVAICLVLGAYSTGRLLGVLFHGTIEPNVSAYNAHQVVITLLLAAILLLAAVQGRHRSTGTSLDNLSTISGNIGRASEKIRAQYGLSPRETEVMRFLARGYSPAYIAQELVISESTARTHATRIYRKLGVCTREELITLVDSLEETC